MVSAPRNYTLSKSPVVVFIIIKGVQYLVKRSFVTQSIWLILLILALSGAAIFASNIFFDWQEERTITSLKTISKPVNELDFPSVTICKDGQNHQAVREVLERERKEWEEEQNKDIVTRRKKRSSSGGSNLGSNYCQLIFKRTCEQVSDFNRTTLFYF